MVSFWPWRGDDSSPASFEKALSALATKITNTQAQLDQTRSTSRRIRVLWTLYLSFAYLVYSIVLVLVVGWKNLGPWEWTGVGGGPVVIYVTRTVLSAFFNYRVDSLSGKLKSQQQERAKTVQKLKDATRYDSTQQLLEKYGGAEAKPSKGKKANESSEGRGTHSQGEGGEGTPRRTTMAPPPTANIQRADGRSPAPGSASVKSRSAGADASPLRGHQSRDMTVSEDFAPNAFGAGGNPPVPNAQYAPASSGAGESRWLDRVMDLLLGEDETASKNRIVLICKQCRLVNGQAPPGTKSLAEVGQWRCMGCRAMNGELDEGKRIVQEVLGKNVKTGQKAAADTMDSDSSDIVDVEKESEEAAESSTTSPNGTTTEDQGGARRRRGKAKK